MTKHTQIAHGATVLFIACTFYSYGTAMMDYFLVYPSRMLIGEEEFVSYHALLEERILPISVLPFLLITVLNLLLFWFRPAYIPRKLVLALFYLSVARLAFFYLHSDSYKSSTK